MRNGLFPWFCCGAMVSGMIYTGTMPLITCVCVGLVVALNYKVMFGGWNE